MNALAAVAALVLIAIILWDSFETIVLPRRVTRRRTLSRLFLHVVWRFWSAIARRMNVGLTPIDGRLEAAGRAYGR